jgi:hypothetical protein
MSVFLFSRFEIGFRPSPKGTFRAKAFTKLGDDQTVQTSGRKKNKNTVAILTKNDI